VPRKECPGIVVRVFDVNGSWAFVSRCFNVDGFVPGDVVWGGGLTRQLGRKEDKGRLGTIEHEMTLAK